jgi:nucleoside-diphosphate-sugar epimerase
LDKTKQILVSGGTGFVGSYLLRMLLHQGYTNIRAIRRKTSRMDLVSAIQDQIEWVEGDILDVLFIEDVMRGVQQVYHCAAMISFDARKFEDMRQVNVEGTANMVNAALHAEVEKFIHVSSIAAIGRPENGMLIDENTKWQRSKNNSQYAISKYQGEQEVWRGHAEGLNMAIVNPSVIFGAGFWDDGPLKFFKLAWKEFSFYSLGQTGIVDVRDVGRFMIQLMESNISGERYILNGSPISFKNLMFRISELLDKKPPRYKVNSIMREIAWRLEWLKSRLFGGSPFITKETARLSGQYFEYANHKSKEAFDFEYTPIDQTLAESATLFKKAAEETPISAKVLPL